MQHPHKKNSQDSKRRNRRIIVFVGVALLLATALVFLFPTMASKDKGSISIMSPRYATLDSGDADDLLKITVNQREGETYTLIYQNENLYLQREGALLAVDEFLGAKILQSATEIAIEDTVSEDVEEFRKHLPDMGLEPAEITVTVEYRGGRSDVLQIGYGVPETTYYYYRWSGANAVYMCNRGVYETFANSSALLLPVDQPVLQKSLIDRMTFEIQGQETIELFLSTDATGVTGGSMQTPYVYPLSASVAGELVTAAVNFRLGIDQGDVTAENMSEYGFDNPIAVIEIHQQSGMYGAIDETGNYQTYEAGEGSLRIVLGRKDGEYFYTCLYEGKCYLVSRFLVGALATVTPDSLITRNPADMGEAVLTEIKVQSGSNLLDFRQQRTERVLENNQLDTDEAGNILYDITTTRNGDPIALEAFNALVARLKSMVVFGDVPEGFSIGTGTPRWQLSLTTQGGVTRTITAYPLDAFFDAIAVDGQVKHTLHIESLEVALADLVE